jgi:sugar-specific transcriptional regulator TrmB
MNSKRHLIAELRALHLTDDEATLYTALLREPSTHLQLSRATGIDRAKIYRLAEKLEKRSLISRHTDDRGTFLAASSPSQLEIELMSQEEELQQQRQVLHDLLPQLTALKNKTGQKAFVVRTYEGEEGFKQMLWHELQAKEEILILGDSPLEDLVSKSRWTERYRERVSQTTLHVRAVFHSDPGEFTKHAVYKNQTNIRRFLDPSIVRLSNQVAIYNDTVATYHVGSEKIGVEVINAAHANLMRDVFRRYWGLSKSSGPPKTS